MLHFVGNTDTQKRKGIFQRLQGCVGQSKTEGLRLFVFRCQNFAVEVEFIELLKQIGYVIGLGVIGLLIYWKGLTYLSFGSEIGTLDILDIVYYGNIGLAIIYTIGTIQLFKKFRIIGNKIYKVIMDLFLCCKARINTKPSLGVHKNAFKI